MDVISKDEGEILSDCATAFFKEIPNSGEVAEFSESPLIVSDDLRCVVGRGDTVVDQKWIRNSTDVEYDFRFLELMYSR